MEWYVWMARACLSHSSISSHGTVQQFVVSSSFLLLLERDPMGHDHWCRRHGWVLCGTSTVPMGSSYEKASTDRDVAGFNRAGRALDGTRNGGASTNAMGKTKRRAAGEGMVAQGESDSDGQERENVDVKTRKVNRFRFKTFAERLADVDLRVYRSAKQVSTSQPLDGNASYFQVRNKTNRTRGSFVESRVCNNWEQELTSVPSDNVS